MKDPRGPRRQPVLINRPAVDHAWVTGPGPSRRGRWLYLLLPLLLVPLLLLAWWHFDDDEQPLAGDDQVASLDDAALAGPRAVTGPVCVDEAVDISGSMTVYDAQRAEAVAAFFQFATRELRADDVFSEAFFAGESQVTIQPTRIDALKGVTPGQAPALSDGTLLAPAITALVQARQQANSVCAARALLVITDGALSDNADELRDALRTAGYTRVHLVVPAGEDERPAVLRGEVLDGVAVHQFQHDQQGVSLPFGDDADELEVIFGRIVADLTGQDLSRRD